jgi:hypothetical protein
MLTRMWGAVGTGGENLPVTRLGTESKTTWGEK